MLSFYIFKIGYSSVKLSIINLEEKVLKIPKGIKFLISAKLWALH